MKTWVAFVQQVYSSLEELESYNEIYNLALRCGFKTAKELWDSNPMIGGSTNPDDFGVIQPTQ